ncbi:MAG: Tetratricopeptide repeat protein [candidate division BRC1 bacterium ADurb.BinA364]|nr:MAG: Tetratricopeptide repeat protein [candidate division BRC1 bacterium ADurb.BinA364]
MDAAGATVGPRPRRWLASAWPVVLLFASLELFIVAIGFRPWLNDRAHRLARIDAREGRYDKAIERYEGLLRQFGDSPTINLELGNAYFHAGQYDKAEQRFTKLIQLSPAPPKGILSRIGEARIALGNRARALESFEAEYRSNPRDPAACFYLGEDRLTKGQALEAAALLERAAFDPRYGDRAMAYLKDIERMVFGDLAEEPAAAPKG